MEKRWKQYKIFLWSALGVACLLFFFSVYMFSVYTIPKKLYLYQGGQQQLTFDMPVTVVATASDGVITSELTNRVVLKTGKKDAYQMQVNLFGMIPVREVSVSVIDQTKVIPMGVPVGIYMHTRGVLVLGNSEITDHNGQKKSPAENILKEGDYILAVNGEPVENKEALMEQIEASQGKELILQIKRNNEEFPIAVTPAQTADGSFKVGIWIRDSAQGIGTLSFIDEAGRFAALGHGILDVDTGVLLDVGYGALYKTDIVSVHKGYQNKPGELTGVILLKEEEEIGDIEQNTGVGVYGTFYQKELPDNWNVSEAAVPIGLKQEIELGEAEILCKIQKERTLYKVKITQVYPNAGDENRGIELEITDERLLEKTGGIVQGMSGAPILQNGRIIGVVTHVFVKNPAKGYGIFIENML